MKTSHAQQRIPINPYWVGVSKRSKPQLLLAATSYRFLIFLKGSAT